MGNGFYDDPEELKKRKLKCPKCGSTDYTFLMRDWKYRRCNACQEVTKSV